MRGKACISKVLVPHTDQDRQIDILCVNNNHVRCILFIICYWNILPYIHMLQCRLFIFFTMHLPMEQAKNVDDNEMICGLASKFCQSKKCFIDIVVRRMAFFA